MVTVVCTGGEEPPMTSGLAWLDQGQSTIAADGGLEYLVRWGRRADLWVGDGDSLTGPLEGWSGGFDASQLLDRDKDDTDTEAAVRLALDRGATEVWLLGGGGGRMDHWWANLRLVAGQPRLTRWLTAREEAWNLGPGDGIDLGPGTVSVFPLGTGPWKVDDIGLKWPLAPVDFRRWHSLGNQVGPQGGHLRIVSGQFLVMRPWDQGGSR